MLKFHQALSVFSGMVAFRLRGDNALTERLLKKLNARGYIHAVPACFKGVYVIRFTVTSQRTTNQDILGESCDVFYSIKLSCLRRGKLVLDRDSVIISPSLMIS